MLDRPLRSALCLVALLLASRASAGDGVLEVNQTCALQTGCFPGDSAGFPVSVAFPGSYRLTSDLAVPNENTTAILVRASDVRLDLNGFVISGATACPGLPPVCAPTGSGSGVDVDDEGLRSAVTVHGGSVRGMGRDGVHLGSQSRVFDVEARENGFAGFELGSGCEIRNCAAQSNAQFGILTSSQCLVSHNRAAANGQIGVQSHAGGVVEENTATQNLVGIRAIGPATVSRNTSSGNRGDGIIVTLGRSTLADNTSCDNVSLGLPNDEDGIVCEADCNAHGNTVSGNGGLGLNLTAHSAYYGNLAVGNGAGGVSGGANLGLNHCSGSGVTSASCP